MKSEITTLYFKEGSSDKVYTACLEPKGKGFVVTFSYGRRGSTMTTGTKTEKPVVYATAKKAYDKLVAEKMAKGYTAGADGTPYQDTPKEDRFTGILPQLLNPIGDDELDRYLGDPDWLAQEKFDGKRILFAVK
jgi:bifunctional non-homologous end joining protein LigD